MIEICQRRVPKKETLTFNTTYVYFKEMISGNEYIGEVYVRTYHGAFMLDNINPVDIEICSDVIDGMIELSIY